MADFTRSDLILKVVGYSPTDAMEKTHRLHTLFALRKVPDVFVRSCNMPGHVATSGWIVNPARTKVLLQKHKYRGIWMPFGGHVDGNPDYLFMLMKEKDEEIGDLAVRILVELFDLDTHQVPANPKKNEGEHLHYDFRVLLEADDALPLPVSPEGIEHAWFTFAEAEAFFPVGGGRRRCLEKIKAL